MGVSHLEAHRTGFDLTLCVSQVYLDNQQTSIGFKWNIS